MIYIPHSHSPSSRQILGGQKYILENHSQFCTITDDYFLKVLVIVFGALYLSWFLLLHICTFVSYVPFDINLSMGFKRNSYCNLRLSMFLFVFFLLGLLLCENRENSLILHYRELILILRTLLNLLLKFHKILSKFCFHFLIILIFSESISPVNCFLCILVFQIWCHTCTKNVPQWLSFILILLANDIELNPGPQFQNNLFSFMNWNVNSLVKGNFERVPLNSIQFNSIQFFSLKKTINKYN